jgi:pimeloyl-ACP methyl ester carboxylesterase
MTDRLLLAVPTALACACLAGCATAPTTPPLLATAAAPAATAGFVAGPRGPIRVDDGGAGPGAPVLLVHGAGGDRSAWRHQLAHLRRTRRAVALDLPGFGESPPPAGGDYTVPAMADAIGAVADGLGLGRFVLVAHSYAGAPASAFAGAHPERLAGLVFVDAMGDQKDATAAEREKEAADLAPERYWATMEARFAFISKGGKAETPAEVLAVLKRTDPAAVRGVLDGTHDHDAAAALSRYPGPRLAIAARQFERWGIQAQVPGIPVQVLDGVSHWPQLDAPTEVNARLDAFLKDLR